MDRWWKDSLTSPIINYLGRRIEKNRFEKDPILIGGCGRSGTTLLLAILSAHPSIYAFPHEVDAFTNWIRDNKGSLYPKRMDRLYRYLITHRIAESTRRWCEKRPANVRYIHEILEYFDNKVKFIHIVRDPRAVCTSRHPEQPDVYWVSAKRWVSDVSYGLKFRDHPNVFTLKYEDLFHDQKNLLTKLLEFIGEAYVQEIDQWFDHATVRKNRAWFKGIKALDPASLDKWKSPEHQQRVFEIVTYPGVKDLAQELSYDLK
jgi:hypothetical protein